MNEFSNIFLNVVALINFYIIQDDRFHEWNLIYYILFKIQQRKNNERHKQNEKEAHKNSKKEIDIAFKIISVNVIVIAVLL